MKTRIEIKNRWTGAIIFELETENNSIKKTLLKAIEEKKDLSDSNLSGSNLRGSNLRDSNLSGSDLRDSDLSDSNLSGSNLSDSNLSGSDLSGSDLRDSNLRGSNLSGSNLSDSNLSGSDLRDSDLEPIKIDFFYVLLHAIKEVSFLKQNLIDGKIDGSTYEGECSCLSGTAFHGAEKNNGVQEPERKRIIMSCRDASRPAERFFLCIRPGDTPETNQAAKIVFDWIEEFENLIK